MQSKQRKDKKPKKTAKQLRPYDFKPIGAEAMADRPVMVRVSVAIRNQVDQLPASQRADLLRQWIEEGLKQWQVEQEKGIQV